MKNKRPLTKLQESILGAIPSGRANARTISEIMDRLALPKHERRNIHKNIEDLIFYHGYPIGSSSDDLTKGLFMIEDHEDLKLASRTLQSRFKRLAKRHKAINNNFYETLKNRGFRNE